MDLVTKLSQILNIFRCNVIENLRLNFLICSKYHYILLEKNANNSNYKSDKKSVISIIYYR